VQSRPLSRLGERLNRVLADARSGRTAALSFASPETSALRAMQHSPTFAAAK